MTQSVKLRRKHTYGGVPRSEGVPLGKGWLCQEGHRGESSSRLPTRLVVVYQCELKGLII